MASAVDAFLRLRIDGDVNLEVQVDAARTGAVYRNAGVFLMILALDQYVARFHLLYSQLGAVSGPGWTDVNVRLPAMMGGSAIMLLAGILLRIAPLRRCLHARLMKLLCDGWQSHAAGSPACATVTITAGSWPTRSPKCGAHLPTTLPRWSGGGMQKRLSMVI